MNQLDQKDEKARGWNRGQITFRLTPDRVAQLRRIAESLPADATVNDVLDRAISVAIASASFSRNSDCLCQSPPFASANVIDANPALRDSVLAQKLDAMQAATESMETTFEQVLEPLAKQIREIHSLLTLASAGTDLLPPATLEPLPNAQISGTTAENDAMSFNCWMALQMESHGGRSNEAVAIKATKLANSHSRSAAGAVDLSCVLFAINGKCLLTSASAATRTTVRIDQIASSDPLASVSEETKICFWCAPSVTHANGWNLHAFSLNRDGSLGTPLGDYHT